MKPGILKAPRADGGRGERDARGVQFSQEIRDLALSSREDADVCRASLDQIRAASDQYLENQQQIELRHLARLSEVKQM